MRKSFPFLQHHKDIEKGFSLVELLIAVTLVAILSALGITTYNKQKDKAYRTTVIKTVTEIEQKIKLCLFSEDYSVEGCNSFEELDIQCDDYWPRNKSMVFPTGRHRNSFVSSKPIACMGKRDSANTKICIQVYPGKKGHNDYKFYGCVDSSGVKHLPKSSGGSSPYCSNGDCVK